MHKAKLIIYSGLICFVLGAFASLPAEAQIFDQIRRQVEGELRRGIQKALPTPSRPPVNTPPPFRLLPTPPVTSDPPIKSQSLPSEGGGKNDSRFDGIGSFFPGGNPNPRPTPNPGNGNPNPGFGNPSYGNPSYGNPGGGQPSQQYYYDAYGNRIYGQPPRTTTPGTQPSMRTVEVPKYSNLPITLKCPKGTPTVSYQLLSGSGSSFSYSMKPGHSQRFNESMQWQVQYVSGGQQVRYRLRGGKTYIFVPDAAGNIQLYQTAEKKPVNEPPMFLGS